ncbi:MAG: polymer-forming cytoskeletal protein [Phycisphaerales bacterium]|nr:polymer-forming cytoskeletal protein [Phycisphaerae bacterium]NNF43840.1 polymer-forming cytoskeletal protein [Phycisphaerales bacterium]NNM27363.1 polymer-forming cytoskeletal protein [Phycisphaerales bacterium]
MAESSQEYGTVIGSDAKFKGDLTFDSAANVLGQFEGSINSKGKVHIADGSACKATISAKEVAVAGRIEGNVQAGDRIELKPTGIVNGDIIASRMTMSEGASINGHCQIGPNGQGTGKATSTTETKPAAAAQPVKSRT